MTPHITTTQIQRNTKASLTSEHPFQIIVANNEVSGILINKKTAEKLLETDLLEQIAEELWEANDPTTRKMIEEQKMGIESDSIDFDEFNAKYAL